MGLLRDLHLAETHSRTSTHPSSRKVHHLEFVGSEQRVRLCMSDRNHVLAVSLDIVCLDIFSSTMVE
jgi:hypothetical protein